MTSKIYDVDDLVLWSEEGEGEEGEGQPGQGQPGGKGKKGKEGSGSETLDQLENSTDDHEPGQKDGQKKKVNVGEKEGKAEDGDIDVPLKPGQTIKDILDEQTKKLKDFEEQASKVNEEVIEGDTSHQKSQNKPGTNKAGKGGVKIRQINDATFSWQELLRRMLKQASNEMEESYRQINRRKMGSAISQASQTGAAAMSPGNVVKEDSIPKIMFVIDSSGSMGHIIAATNNNIKKIVNSSNTLKNAFFPIIRFTGDFEMVLGSFSKNTYTHITSVQAKASGLQPGFSDWFEIHKNAGTVFDITIATRVKESLTKGFNTVLFTDSDILAADNFNNLKPLLTTGPGKMFVVMASKSDYEGMLTQLNVTSHPNITYFT